MAVCAAPSRNMLSEMGSPGSTFYAWPAIDLGCELGWHGHVQLTRPPGRIRLFPSPPRAITKGGPCPSRRSDSLPSVTAATAVMRQTARALTGGARNPTPQAAQSSRRGRMIPYHRMMLSPSTEEPIGCISS